MPQQQPQRPDSPSDQFGMYTEFEPDKRSALNGYHRSSFTAIPNATRPSKHLATPSSTMPSTNPTIYRDSAFQQDAYGHHLQSSFAPSFGVVEQFANYKPHPHSVMSQTPYGPHLTNSANPGHGNVANGTGNGMQEDISTIFVVGFPDDMQEREFQNMFTFSAGFEAATLKIPNREYTAYGIPPTAPPPGIQSLSSAVRAQDPFSLVAMNQGAVDGSRDGSWPTAPMDDSYYQTMGTLGGLGVGGPSNLTLGPTPNPNNSGTINGPVTNTGPVPPRKQIIGFAKFRTREEALEARDVLQGRRVDIEKGAVLKAEMAKKNLHTKRGVTANGSAGTNIGPLNGGGIPLGSNGSVPLASGGIGFTGNPPLSQHEVFLPGPPHPQILPDLGFGGMSARERELGTLGAMGFSSNAPHGPSAGPPGSLSKLWDEDVRGRDRKVYDAMGLGLSSGDESSGPISAKEGGRRRSEAKPEDRNEKQPLRLRSGSAFEAFHSVPVSASLSQGGLVSPPLPKAKPFTLSSSLTHEDASTVPGPWDHFTHPSTKSQPPPSSKPSRSSNGHSRSSRSSSIAAGSTHSRRSAREEDDDVYTNPELELEDPNATAREIDVAQIARAVGSLAVSNNTHVNGNANSVVGSSNGGINSQGNTSPQLPSPSSGSSASVSGLSASGVSGSAVVSNSSSSSSLRHAAAVQSGAPLNFPSQNPTSNPNLSHLLSSTVPGLVSGVDQNPPINTLYVGNLPISPPPLGYPPDILEESLRELFRTRPGYRRLSFKQKSTGPMCFVEFDDVNAATKTINELYGNTLNGLVKGGGIRLSYSKNPLGVRTPTSANGPGPSLQQQHLQQTGRDGDRDRSGYGGVQALSPTPRHHSSNHRATTHEYMISPPPPRFAGASAGANTMPNVPFGTFSSPSFGGAGSHMPTGASSSNYMFGTTNTFQGGPGPVGYRLTSSDAFGDGQGLGSPFSPFDGHVDHPQMPHLSPMLMQHQGPNPNQNQNF